MLSEKTNGQTNGLRCDGGRGSEVRQAFKRGYNRILQSENLGRRTATSGVGSNKRSRDKNGKENILKSSHLQCLLIFQSQKIEMANSFKKNGIQRCRIDTVIKVGMKREWLKEVESKEIEGLAITEIPEMNLTDNGKVASIAGEIKPMEGLGRRGGIEILFKEYEKELGILRSKRKKVEKKPKNKSDEEKLGLDVQIEELEEKLKECPYWTFRVIDQGEL